MGRCVATFERYVFRASLNGTHFLILEELKMKKVLWLALLLIIVCALSFTACNQNNTPPNNDNVECEHNFGDWITEKQANCKEEGLLTRVCTKCAHKEETTIAKTDIHTQVIDQAIEATCSNVGLTEGKHCSVCEKVLVAQAEIPMSAHTEEKDEAVEATCTETGLSEGSHCSVCGTTLVAQNVTSMLEHSYSSIVTAPTCTERGYTSYTCGCGDGYISDYVDASGHNFGDWETIKEATTTEEGLQERTCQCGEKESKVISIVYSKGLEYKKHYNGYYIVSGIGTCSDTEIVIPSTYNSYPVLEIGDGAFRNCTTITSISIPDSVTTIGASVFYGCTSLENVTIPDSITKIGEGSFMRCSSLETIDLPYNLTKVSSYLFEQCTSLKSIVIPDNVSYVGYSFYGCTSLESVTLGKNVTDVYYCAFQNSGVTTLIIKGNIIPFDENLSETYMDNLKTVVIEGSVTAIREDEFRGCSLLETVVLPDGVLTIGIGTLTCWNEEHPAKA